MAFPISFWEAEAGAFVSSKPAWPTEQVSGQPALHRETLPLHWGNKGEAYQTRAPGHLPYTEGSHGWGTWSQLRREPSSTGRTATEKAHWKCPQPVLEPCKDRVIIYHQPSETEIKTDLLFLFLMPSIAHVLPLFLA